MQWMNEWNKQTEQNRKLMRLYSPTDEKKDYEKEGSKSFTLLSLSLLFTVNNKHLCVEMTVSHLFQAP